MSDQEKSIIFSYSDPVHAFSTWCYDRIEHYLKDARFSNQTRTYDDTIAPGRYCESREAVKRGKPAPPHSRAKDNQDGKVKVWVLEDKQIVYFKEDDSHNTSGENYTTTHVEGYRSNGKSTVVPYTAGFSPHTGKQLPKTPARDFSKRNVQIARNLEKQLEFNFFRTKPSSTIEVTPSFNTQGPSTSTDEGPSTSKTSISKGAHKKKTLKENSST